MNQINSLPKGKIVFNKQRNRKSIVVYSSKNGKRTRSEHYLESEKGQICFSLTARREKIQKVYDKYSPYLSNSIKLDNICVANRQAKSNILQSSLFEFCRSNVIPESEKTEDRYLNTYNGIKMTSRAEVTIAEVLSSLDFEFIYEPKIHIGAHYFVPDFLVNVPELNCCFFIEYLGMLDNTEYSNKNFEKIKVYQLNGISTDTSLLVIWDNGKSMTDPTKIRFQLEGMINYLTSIHISSLKPV